MKPETKQRITKVVDLGVTALRYGFIPYVIYLGFKRGADEGMPPIQIWNLFV